MTRVLRVTLLAPDIVEAILDGRQGSKVVLGRLLEAFPADWQRQGEVFWEEQSRPAPAEECGRRTDRLRLASTLDTN